MSFFVPKLYAAPYSSLDTLMNDQMNFFDMKLQGGTKLMVQSYVFASMDWNINFVSPCIQVSGVVTRLRIIKWSYNHTPQIAPPLTPPF